MEQSFLGAGVHRRTARKNSIPARPTARFDQA
jgi:hypothetical protein